LVSDADVTLCLSKKVGEHVVGGAVIGWVGAPSPDDPAPAAEPFDAALDADVRIGFGGLFGRYGSSDLVVMLALLRLFETVVEVLPPGSPRLAVIDRVTVEALGDAERSIPRPTSLERIGAAVKALRSKINSPRELKPTSAT
jgi:uncharacterized membrane protein